MTCVTTSNGSVLLEVQVFWCKLPVILLPLLSHHHWQSFKKGPVAAPYLLCWPRALTDEKMHLLGEFLICNAPK